MKLQYGKRYVRRDGGITGPLKVNPDNAIHYPYLDESYGVAYSEEGKIRHDQAEYPNYLVSVVYNDPSPIDFDNKTDSDVVVISGSEYRRFTAIEAAFKELYIEAKRLGISDEKIEE